VLPPSLLAGFKGSRREGRKGGEEGREREAEDGKGKDVGIGLVKCREKRRWVRRSICLSISKATECYLLSYLPKATEGYRRLFHRSLCEHHPNPGIILL